MNLKNEKEKIQLLVEKRYNYLFRRGDSSILEHHHCEEKSTVPLSNPISFDRVNVFKISFHSDGILRLKIHPCEYGNYIVFLPRVEFFLFHFSRFFQNFFN